MKYKQVAIAATLTAALASNASAVIIDDTDIGSTWNAQWAASISGENVFVTAALTLDTVVANIWGFTVTFNNQSNAGAELAGWGFSTDPDLAPGGFSLLSSPSAGWSTGSGPSGSDQNGNALNVDYCAYAGPNCDGGGSNGFLGIGVFEFTLTFADVIGFFELTDAYTRLQSVGLNNGESAKLISTVPFTPQGGPPPPPPPSIPLPGSSWLVLIGLLGMVPCWRRRRNA